MDSGLAVFLRTPIINFLLIGIPHHPETDQNHWQAQELSLTHPCNKELTIDRVRGKIRQQSVPNHNQLGIGQTLPCVDVALS